MRENARERKREETTYMSSTKRWLVPVAVCAAAIGIGACGSDSDDSSSTSADSGSSGGGKIAFLLPETQTARYETQDKPLFEQKVAGALPRLRDPVPERRPGPDQAAVAG